MEVVSVLCKKEKTLTVTKATVCFSAGFNESGRRNCQKKKLKALGGGGVGECNVIDS